MGQFRDHHSNESQEQEGQDTNKFWKYLSQY